MSKLEKIDQYGWKQCYEGIDRGITGPFEQVNTFDGECSCRELFEKNKVVMRMLTWDDGWQSSHECQQEFYATKKILKAVEGLVPTQEEEDE